MKGTPPARPGASVSPRSQKRPLATSPLRLSEPDTPRRGCCARRRPHAAAGRGAPVRTCAHLPPTRRVPAAGWGAREKLGAPRPQGADGFRSSRAAVLAGGAPAAPRRRRPGLGGKPPAPSRRPSPRVCSAREAAPAARRPCREGTALTGSGAPGGRAPPPALAGSRRVFQGQARPACAPRGAARSASGRGSRGRVHCVRGASSEGVSSRGARGPRRVRAFPKPRALPARCAKARADRVASAGLRLCRGGSPGRREAPAPPRAGLPGPSRLSASAATSRPGAAAHWIRPRGEKPGLSGAGQKDAPGGPGPRAAVPAPNARRPQTPGARGPLAARSSPTPPHAPLAPSPP